MDEKTLESSIYTHRQQLQQVDTVLQSAGTEGQDELIQLKKDLEEVIQLTEESLLSLKKSKLLSFVDGTTSKTNDGKDSSGSGVLSMDEEYEAFKMMLSEDLKNDDQPSQEPKQTPADEEEAKVEMQEDDNDEDRDKIDLELQEEVTGTKCSLMYSQEWGAKERHNAIILNLEPKTNHSDEVCVRILFCNPTHQSMRPCPFFLDGKCKFDVDACRFSHGHVVSLSELAEFQEPDFRSLEVGSKCLARYDKDQLWYPAEIDAIEKDFHKYKVKFESYGNNAVLGLDEILPRASHVESSSDEDENDEDNPTDSVEGDVNLPSTSKGLTERRQDEPEYVPTEVWRTIPGVALGQWEEHTRGIGSRLMAKMGYEYGQGLGKHNQGRIEIVEAVVLPPGKSLDKCMQLKEGKKCLVVGAKKKKTKGKPNHHGSKKTVKKRKDVFAFINNKLKGRKAKISDLLHQNIELVKTDRRLLQGYKAEPSSGRQINIQLVKTQEEITNTNKEIMRLRQTLDRHERDKKTRQHIEFKIAEKQKYVESLSSSEKKLEKQQATRNHHRKLTIF